MCNGKCEFLLNILWAYELLELAGACASPKGTFMYSYFPNGEVNAILELTIHPAECGGILLIGLMSTSS